MNLFYLLFEPEKSAKKSYEAYEYVTDDYYSLDQQLATLNVDSNQAGFGGEVDTAELFPSEVERSADVSFIFKNGIWIFILAEQKRTTTKGARSGQGSWGRRDSQARAKWPS